MKLVDSGKPHSRFGWLATAALSTTLLLSGCGGEQTPESSEQAENKTRETSSQASTQLNRKHPKTGELLLDKQVLIIGNGSEPPSIDPQLVEDSVGGNIVRDLFEGLTNSGPKGEVLPGVATHWESSDDFKTWTFHLRKDAKWSDGSPVTAEDFVYAWQRAVDPELGSTYSYYLEIASVENATEIMNGKAKPETLGVRAVDAHTFEVKLTAPIQFIADMATHYTMFPTPRKAIEAHGRNWTKPGNIVSNGAFVLDSWNVGEKLVVKRNPEYWNNENNLIDQAVYLPIEDTYAELQRYEAGEIHYTSTLPSTEVDRIREERPNELTITPYLGTYMMQFNLQKEPFDDVRVRKALTYAIDRDIITQYITRTGQIPAYSMTPFFVNGFEFEGNEYGTWDQAKRDEVARELIKEAGFNEDNPLKFELLYNTNDGHKQIAVALGQMWKEKLGVQSTPTNMEWKTFLSERQAGNFEVARYGWIADYNEASTFLSLLLSSSGQNDGKWSNPEYDRLVQEAKFSANPNEQYVAAEKILAEDFPVAPIYFYTNVAMVSPQLRGYPVDNPQNMKYSRDMYLVAE